MNLYVYRCPECPTKVELRARVTMLQCVSGPHEPRPMQLVPDTDQALVPMDPPAPIPGMLTPLKVEHLRHVGILMPATQHALEWMYRHRATNGMAGAFLMVGGRRCIDLVAFARLMREQRA